jgi:hypothetical protein
MDESKSMVKRGWHIEAAQLLGLDLRRWARRFSTHPPGKIDTLWKAVVSLSYKERVLELHPDRTGGDPIKTEAFIRVQEARPVIEALTRQDMKAFLPPPPKRHTIFEYFTEVLSFPIWGPELEYRIQHEMYLRRKGVVFNSHRRGTVF